MKTKKDHISYGNYIQCKRWNRCKTPSRAISDEVRNPQIFCSWVVHIRFDKKAENDYLL